MQNRKVALSVLLLVLLCTSALAKKDHKKCGDWTACDVATEGGPGYYTCASDKFTSPRCHVDDDSAETHCKCFKEKVPATEDWALCDQATACAAA